MGYLNIALAQINPVVGDLKGNLAKILELSEYVAPRVHLIVFPELALTGYLPEDLLFRKDFIRDVHATLEELRRKTRELELLILLGLPYSSRGSLFNSACLLYKGDLLGIYHKRKLSRLGASDEGRYFDAGGDFLFFKVGDIICEVSIGEDFLRGFDRKEEPDPTRAKVLINLSACPYVYGDYRKREELYRIWSTKNRALIVSVNLAGGQDELIFDGRSMVISPRGEILARARAFEEDILLVSLWGETLRGLNTEKAEEEGTSEESESKVISVSIAPKENIPYYDGRVEEALEEEAELYNAIKVSIADYVRKNNFKGVVLGLSGGIDSALVATLAVDALGRERVIAIFMRSEFTSRESYEDAQELAENLGITLLEFPISRIFDTFRKEFEVYLGYRDFTVAEENLQARIRANILFYFSNREGYLVLSTSNKSESATGYGTIYGDMAGGFAPLKDVYKTWVYQLARYRNSISPVIPERIFTKPPSAELRPGQIDQEILPPYEVLDEILRLHLEEGFTPEELIGKGFEETTVNRVMKMLKMAEYKRRQAPPGPKVTRRALGRDYRIPITSAYI